MSQAEVFAALGDPTRLELIRKLTDGRRRSIADLGDGIEMSRQAISKHLRVLEHVGLVTSEVSGRENLFQFNPTVLVDARKFLDDVSAQWDVGLSRLKAFVEE